uniref:Transmembrane protein n=1 Tax=Neospora caninum (strain Liverpool) TaxID=572307 RepID=A0A0F7UMJ2_NEOCL|nr:TPA: hypothetical protein BN1204_054325 [Neospora caninum Liverpool]
MLSETVRCSPAPLKMSPASTQTHSRKSIVPAYRRGKMNLPASFLLLYILKCTLFVFSQAEGAPHASRPALPASALGTAEPLPRAYAVDHAPASSPSLSTLLPRGSKVDQGKVKNSSRWLRARDGSGGDRVVKRHERALATHRPAPTTPILSPGESPSTFNQYSRRSFAPAGLSAKQREEATEQVLADEQRRAVAAVEAVFAQLTQFHPDAYETANVRGLIKWWEDPYIIILLCLSFGGLVSMGIWCLVASYR